jgi:hypothetical protein
MKKNHLVVGIFFACKSLNTEVRLSLDHDHYIWVNPQDASRYNMTSADYQAFQAWQNQ